MAQRDRASLSIEDIAKVTKIPERSLKQLEAGDFEKLPADVFVRGFLRSYARCVGVDADELIRRYSQCGGLEPPPVASDFARTAAEQLKALAQTEKAPAEIGVVRAAAPAEPNQIVAEPASEPEPVSDPESGSDTDPESESDPDDDAPSLQHGTAAPVRTHGKRKKTRKQRRHRGGERPTPQPIAAEAEPVAKADSEHELEHEHEPQIDHENEAVAAVPAVTPRRETQRQRAFLPPAWSETEPGNRRGPLTLAVIILVIVATLTMSYLLRRPSYSGDGVTLAPTTGETARIGAV
ncbi:MAG TPA: helix-turn-helix domain-containing protein [Kofleriaceae bacterium]|nr:helix-turn-helix domain-containing protein [Kofleriaceae bacterium]